MYADDMAAGADTLEELFEIYKALIIALDNAGIQIKASKVEFGVEEITLHNYRVIGGDGPMANTTTPKDETLDPIRSCSNDTTISHATQGVSGLHPTDGPIRALLRVNSRPLAQAHAQRRSLPNGIQMDPGIRLRPRLPSRKEPNVRQAFIHLEQKQRASQLP